MIVIQRAMKDVDWYRVTAKVVVLYGISRSHHFVKSTDAGARWERIELIPRSEGEYIHHPVTIEHAATLNALQFGMDMNHNQELENNDTVNNLQVR